MQDFRSIYGNMMQEYVVGRIRALNAERNARINALKAEKPLEIRNFVREPVPDI